MDESSPFVSIIVPVYKVERFIAPCIESIMEQTFSDWELILVEDGSCDGSAAICRHYARKDPRLRIVTRRHCGPGGRNAGIDLARGRFLTFVDSDDLIDPDYIATLLSMMRQGVGIAAVGHQDVRGAAMRPLTRKERKAPVRVINPRKAVGNMLYQTGAPDTSVWGKLFRRELWEGIRLPEGKVYEDLATVYKVMLNAECVALCAAPLYGYRITPGSIMRTFSARRADVLSVTRDVEADLRARGEKRLLKGAIDRRLSANFNIFALLAAHGDPDPQLASECWNTIRKLRLRSLLDPAVRWKNKLGILLSYIAGPKATARLARRQYSGASAGNTALDDRHEPVSIIIPVYNRPKLIVRCLDSIKAQTWRPIRVIVVDNASTDDTASAVSNWAALHSGNGLSVRLLHEEVRGAAAARERGLRNADTRISMHFDSDDTMHPDHVERIMRRFEDDPALQLVAFRIPYHRVGGGYTLNKTPGRDPMATQLVHCYLPTQGYAATTELLRAAGGWNPRLRVWEDWDLGVRILLQNPRMIYMPQPSVDVFCREDSVTGVDFHSRMGRWESAIDAVEEAVSTAPAGIRLKWRRYVCYRRVILAAHYHREGFAADARALLKSALGDKALNAPSRAYLRMAFHYTARGGRGAALITPLLF